MLKVKKLLHSLNFLDVFILVCLVFFFSLLFFGNTGIIAINCAEDFFFAKNNICQTFTNRKCFEICLDYRTPLEMNWTETHVCIRLLINCPSLDSKKKVILIRDFSIRVHCRSKTIRFAVLLLHRDKNKTYPSLIY